MEKKKAAKKATAKKAIKPKKGSSSIGELTLDMALDDQKSAAIQRCIQKGRLKLTVKQVDLSTGKVGEAWTYD